jgi:archaeosine synthase beta-subunit
VSASVADQRIRNLRPPKPYVDPFAAHGSLVEEERRPDGTIERALTVFLAGAECPFTCSFCDLWRYTIDGPTPNGALPAQLRRVLDGLDAPLPERVKLYNASNFFDRRAIPPADIPAIAELSRGFSGVTVESHVNTIGAATLDFARRIPGRLEVAVGLETIHPLAAARINKRLDLARFEQAARFLAGNGIDLRVFVLLGAPHVPAAESVEWTVLTVEHAVNLGASVVSIIPVRGGNGEMERLQQLGEFTPPTFAQLEDALDSSLKFSGTVITADLWDAEKLPACEHCRAPRIERLRRMNISGRAEPRVSCAICGGR